MRSRILYALAGAVVAVILFVGQAVLDFVQRGAKAQDALTQMSSEGWMENGRFQLLEGKYTAAVKSTVSSTGYSAAERDGVFRLDTRTGRAWLFKREPGEDGDEIYWKRIDDIVPPTQ